MYDIHAYTIGQTERQLMQSLYEVSGSEGQGGEEEDMLNLPPGMPLDEVLVLATHTAQSEP